VRRRGVHRSRDLPALTVKYFRPCWRTDSRSGRRPRRLHRAGHRRHRAAARVRRAYRRRGIHDPGAVHRHPRPLSRPPRHAPMTRAAS
jgi:hypothetical protein